MPTHSEQISVFTHFIFANSIFINDCNDPKESQFLLYSVLQYWLH